ncbi:MAG TPA: tryptophan--tRNA ligase [Candidatus Dormibacteraeota bacterium]|nr:tryptophan--tRNA ligase [Candidatus Dormibacteraeota bacterium]
METSLTGIKPSGTVHIGNYLGAIVPAIEMAQRYERSLYFIADEHALTTVQDSAKLRAMIYDLAAAWLACGLDPERTLFYRQSSIPEVFELAWILGCVAPKGLLDRAHAYKAAVAAGESINAGVYTYPVLMAADIILFDTTVVPVGKDQKQHVEIARDLALKFNHVFGETLVPPEPEIRDEVMTIPGLDGRKMSKSYDNVIPLFAPADELRKLVMRIKTNSQAPEEPKDPQTSEIFQLYRLFATPEQTEELRARYAAGIGWAKAKEALHAAMEHRLAPLRERYEALRADEGALDRILAQGAERARVIAGGTMARVRKAVGLA